MASGKHAALFRAFGRLPSSADLSLVKKLLAINPSGHGFAGWLPVERVRPPRDALRDRTMMDVIERSAFGAIADLEHPLKRFFWFLRAKGDPNDWRIVRRDAFVFVTSRSRPRITPAALAAGSGLEVARRYPDRLHVELEALASRVV